MSSRLKTHADCLPTSMLDHFVKEQVLVICLVLGQVHNIDSCAKTMRRLKNFNKTKKYFDNNVPSRWAFSAACPRIWNSLPADLQKPDMSFFQFRWSLTHSCLCSDAKAACELFNGAIELFLLTYQNEWKWSKKKIKHKYENLVSNLHRQR